MTFLQSKTPRVEQIFWNKKLLSEAPQKRNKLRSKPVNFRIPRKNKVFEYPKDSNAGIEKKIPTKKNEIAVENGKFWYTFIYYLHRD